MRLNSRLAAALAVASTMMTALPALAATRITEAAIPAPVAAGQLAPAGRMAADTVMAVSVSLPVRHPAARDAMLRAIYDPASANYRHFLTVAQYAAQFGPTKADFAAAADYFRSMGLTVDDSAANRSLLKLTGRAADIERAFHVTMNYYQHPTEHRLFFAADRTPSVDTNVRLLDVIGLDNYQLPQPRLIRPQETAMGARTTGSGPNGAFLGSDMRAAYYGRGTLTGAGQTVGLMELAGYNLTSVQTYFSKVGQPLNVPVTGIATDSAPLGCTGSCDDSEQALDIEYTISMAPGLAGVEVYVGNNAEDVLNSQVSRDTSQIVSTSWGWNEKFTTDDNIFKEMALQGQTNLTASGDYSSLLASGPWPEEDANITAVGGTDLVTNGPGGTWKSETGWSSSAGGPSVDKTILIEPYQLPYINTANGGSTTLRNVPDVAAQANINMYYCANSGCGVAGGTSFASPMWAGFVALANQQAASEGHGPAGWINPILYQYGNTKYYKFLFHDETSGKSGKFTCTTNYDLVTGLGSPSTDMIKLLSRY